VRWAGWTMAIATALVISGAQARADVASDRPAAIVVYPKIVVDSAYGVDTIIRLTNTNTQAPINVHCFYVDANSHCTSDGSICKDSSTCGYGTCAPGWVETDFDIVLTMNQPIEWEATDGFWNDDLPLPYGVCKGNQFIHCGTGPVGDKLCQDFNACGGAPPCCTPSNSGTHIPPVAEDPFVGELKCIAVNDPVNNVPIARNDLKGEVKIETSTETELDVASYNAIGIQATAPAGTLITDNPLVLGPGSAGDYNGCPNVLILDSFFDLAADPITGDTITTDLTLVPCSEDFLRQIAGSATVQYLVYNEFEQRLSTSRLVSCFQETEICNIDTTQCPRSIFAVGFEGTLTGQIRINPVVNPAVALPSGLLGIAIERHGTDTSSAAFNLHFAGVRDTADLITLP
jgi:hypothetical protein